MTHAKHEDTSDQQAAVPAGKGASMGSRTKTCEARIANMRSMIGTSPRLERQNNEHTTIINFQFKEE